MRIAIMGTGGVGGYYGALLARAGHQVIFVARGKHLEAILGNGLSIRSVLGDFQVHPAEATSEPASIGAVDLVLFTTKTYHIDEAAPAILPLVGARTIVLPLQNGVDAADRIGAVVGTEHVIGGATWLSAAIEAPGIIGQYSQFRRIVLGEFDGRISDRVKSIFDVLKSTGITVEIVDNIVQVLWTKFVFISAISALGAMTRVPTGDYRFVPESRAMLMQGLSEVVAVAEARGVVLAPDIIESTLEFIDGAPGGMIPSMQRDMEAGRRFELESMVGIVTRLAADSGVPTPVMNIAYAVLKPGALKAEEANLA